MDLTKRIIKLEAKDTKTYEPRVVFLCQQAYDILKEAGRVRFLEHNRVFTYRGAPLKKVKKAFTNACRKAEINDFRFHDRRHTFITNMRKAGVDHSVIMKLTGHKTAAIFLRYNSVELEDARGAYQKLEELLDRGQDWGATLAEKCSPGAPEGGSRPL
ncbi:MAG: site-specific integrase [Syntrophales bacterium]|nr:site-specific integrase [Syntrophales bacterium]MDD5643441.1 site-specific integrase [Syntrophales bacterium]